MNVEILKTIEAHYQIKEAWNNLVAEMDYPEIFYCWEWTITYLEKLYKKANLFSIAIYDHSKLIALAPLCIERRKNGHFKYNILQPITSTTEISYAITDYSGFCIHPQYDTFTIIKKIIAVVSEYRKEWDYVELRNFNAKNNYAPSIIRAFKEYGFHCESKEGSICPYLEINKVHDSADMAHLKIIARRMKSIHKISDAKFFIDQKFDQDIWMEFMRLHEIKWGRSPNTEFQTNFYKNLNERLKESNEIEFSYLEIEGKIVAGHWGFKKFKTIYWYMPILSSEYKNLHPGTLLLWSMIEHYEKNNYLLFDFLRGNEQYKRNWTNKFTVNYNLTVIPRSFKNYYMLLFYKVHGWAKNIRKFANNIKI